MCVGGVVEDKEKSTELHMLIRGKSYVDIRTAERAAAPLLPNSVRLMHLQVAAVFSKSSFFFLKFHKWKQCISSQISPYCNKKVPALH